MHQISVEDFADPRLADYQNLKDSTLSRARGRFIVEGRGTLRTLLSRSPYRPESILLSQRTFASMEAELDEFEPECPVFVGSQTLLDRVVGFPIHRGCVASCARGDALGPIGLARSIAEREVAPRIIVLEGVLNLDNVGLIFRNAMALGARAVLLCPRSCDPLYRKAIRTSMGASLCVPFARTRDLSMLLAELRGSGYEILAFDPAESSVGIHSLDATRLGPTALLFGTEGSGLSDAALDASDGRVRIEMEPGVDSLNVSVAAGIALSMLRVDDRLEARTDDGKGRQ
jgi:tRNA G18 (ribose-2'-O)-methylase SpoU